MIECAESSEISFGSTANASRASDVTQFVSFLVDKQLFGVHVNTVQEVLCNQAIGPVPKARSEIAGLLNLRGQIVTAVNIRKCLGLPDLGDTMQAMNVVVRRNGEPFSILVDEVGDVIEVTRDSIVPVPNTLDAKWRDLTESVVRLEDQLLIVLNVDELLKL